MLAPFGAGLSPPKLGWTARLRLRCPSCSGRRLPSGDLRSSFVWPPRSSPYLSLFDSSVIDFRRSNTHDHAEHSAVALLTACDRPAGSGQPELFASLLMPPLAWTVEVLALASVRRARRGGLPGSTWESCRNPIPRVAFPSPALGW